jgi:hypothetical protein
VQSIENKNVRDFPCFGAKYFPVPLAIAIDFNKASNKLTLER